MKNLLKFSISIIFLLFIPIISSAATGDVSYKIQIPSFLNSNIKDIPSLVDVIINSIVIPIGAVVAVLMIMWAGWLYVTSGGNPGNVTKAKDALINAVIGSAILLGAKIIAEVVKATITNLK